METHRSQPARQQLIEFLNRRLGNIGPVSRETKIEGHYGIAELDTLVLYDEFISEFNIIVPKNLNLDNNISPVVFHNWRHILKRWFSKKYRDATQYVDLTVGQLDDMISVGYWTLNAMTSAHINPNKRPLYA